MAINIQCKRCASFDRHMGWCEGRADSPDPDIYRCCSNFVAKTNADGIREKTDLELVKFLSDFVECHLPDGYELSENFDKDLIEWLKEENETSTVTNADKFEEVFGIPGHCLVEPNALWWDEPYQGDAEDRAGD